METFLQGLVVSFREGLEAFLIIAILLKFLDRTENYSLKKNVWFGLAAGIIFSFVFGLVLMGISTMLGGLGPAAKLWESFASLVAVILIITFIIWMIHHGSKIKHHMESKAALDLSAKGIFLLSLFMVAREGAEIALFQFAGQYLLSSIILGLVISVILVFLIYHSMVKIKLSTIFNITLAYLILQAGFLLGYSVHEGLSAAKDLGAIPAQSPIFIKAFDLSSTILEHKQGILGLPLYVLIGWYSRPEWIQFILQYGLTILLFVYWHRYNARPHKHKS